MKKVISVVLCAVMLLSCLSLASFAEGTTVTYTESGSFAASDVLVSGGSYFIPAGVKMTVPSDLTLYVATNCNLTVEKGGTLVVLGNVIVKQGGTLTVEGSITGGQKVDVEKGGNAWVNITYPAFADAGINEKIETIQYCFGDTPTADLADKFLPFDEYNTTVGTLSPDGGYFSMPLNKVLFLKTVFNEDHERPMYDPALFRIYFNGSEIDFKQAYRSAMIANAGELSFSHWTNDADFYRTFKIELPSGEGYEVIGRDDEISADGTVYIKYGEPFAFRVEVDEAYDMSRYQVYIYNGYGFLGMDPIIDTETGKITLDKLEPVQPIDGYYVIDKVINDTTVYVEGMVKNDTINLISTIIEAIRSIIGMIREFFTSLFPSLAG